MEPLSLLPLAVAVVVLPLVLSAERWARRAQLRSWQSVAARHGLRDVVTSHPLLTGPTLRGFAGSRQVRFSRYRVSKSDAFTCLTVEGDSGVSLQPQRSASLLTRDLTKLSVREIELGDATFDAEVEIRGAPDRVRALLDVETRRIVLRMLDGRLEPPGGRMVSIGGRAELVDGNLQATFTERPSPPTRAELSDALTALLALAERFDRPASLPERLAAAFGAEPLWQVRLHAVQLLATSYPNHPASRAALRDALGDEHPQVALQAALALADEGHATLLEVACRDQVDDATAAHAVHALGDRLPVEVGLSALRQSLRLRRVQTADACIHALGRLGGAEVAGLLAKVLSVESGSLAVAAARALGGFRRPEVEEALLRALPREVPELALAVIEALGHVGSVDAVPAIQDAAARPVADAAVRRAARQAVAEIQSRLPGASPGQLSIAESEAGHLSLADDDPRGRVTLPAEGQ